MIFDALGMMALGEYPGWGQVFVALINNMMYWRGKRENNIPEWLWLANRL